MDVLGAVFPSPDDPFRIVLLVRSAGRSLEESGRHTATWRGGWLVGVVCFALGYVGPLVITPKSNLGPLLGILLTGPLGFVAGALGTIVYRKLRVQRNL
jgi:hypothetical protein